MTTDSLCNSNNCFTPSCCSNYTTCSNNVSLCYNLCGQNYCPINQCCKHNECLSEIQCFFERNLTTIYYFLGFLIILFIFAGIRWHKNQEFHKSLFQKKKKPIVQQQKKIPEEIPHNNPIEVAKVDALYTMNEPLQQEVRLTERGEFLNSELNIPNEKEIEGFKSNDKKDLNKYIMGYKSLHINLRNLSLTKTAEKIRKIFRLNRQNQNKNEGKNKSIHISQPMTRVLEIDLIQKEIEMSHPHKKYSSLKDGPLQHSGNQTP